MLYLQNDPPLGVWVEYDSIDEQRQSMEHYWDTRTEMQTDPAQAVAMQLSKAATEDFLSASGLVDR
jgi:hypothetical protein